jgi:hypothetical protein
MMEDRLRTMLAERAEAAPDNPARVGQVRSRVRAVRRWRAAGAAAAVAAVVAGGVALTRLPGAPEAAPTGSPWFGADGVPRVPGYVLLDQRSTEGGPVTMRLTLQPVPLTVAVVARCSRPGSLDVRAATGGWVYRLDCGVRARGGYEGLLTLGPGETGRILAVDPADADIRFEPRAGGRWTVGLMLAAAPDRLLPAEGPVLAAGTDTTVPVTLRGGDLTVFAECVRGVRLSLSVRGRPLAEVVCDEDHGLFQGRAQATVPTAGLGRPGAEVPVTIRSTGRTTDQWRVLAVR